VLDGVAGTITFYDAADIARIILGQSANLFELSTTDASETIAGNIDAVIDGAGGSRRLGLQLISPEFDSVLDTAVLIIESESFDGTQPPRFVLTSNSGAGMDIVVAGKTLGRGVIRQIATQVANGPHADLANTDMVLNNVPVISGHLYAIHLHTEVLFSAVIARWIAQLTVNGTVVGRFDDQTNRAATAFESMFDGTVHWTAPATQATDDFVVQVDEVTATASTLQLIAGAVVPRTLTITDLGIPAS
jgi:hypothetical protein